SEQRAADDDGRGRGGGQGADGGGAGGRGGEVLTRLAATRRLCGAERGRVIPRSAPQSLRVAANRRHWFFFAFSDCFGASARIITTVTTGGSSLPALAKYSRTVWPGFRSLASALYPGVPGGPRSFWYSAVEYDDPSAFLGRSCHRSCASAARS